MFSKETIEKSVVNCDHEATHEHITATQTVHYHYHGSKIVINEVENNPVFSMTLRGHDQPFHADLDYRK